MGCLLFCFVLKCLQFSLRYTWSQNRGHRFLGFTITSKCVRKVTSLCVWVLGVRYRNNAAPKPNLPMLQFCLTTIHNIIIFSLLSELSNWEKFCVCVFLWEFQSVFPKRVTRFDTKSKSIIWNASGQCNSALYRGVAKVRLQGKKWEFFAWVCR